MLSKGPIGNEEFITFDLTLDTKPTDIPILSKVVSILFLDYVSELKKNLSIFVLVVLYLLVTEGQSDSEIRVHKTDL